MLYSNLFLDYITPSPLADPVGGAVGATAHPLGWHPPPHEGGRIFVLLSPLKYLTLIYRISNLAHGRYDFIMRLKFDKFSFNSKILKESFLTIIFKYTIISNNFLVKILFLKTIPLYSSSKTSGTWVDSVSKTASVNFRHLMYSFVKRVSSFLATLGKL